MKNEFKWSTTLKGQLSNNDIDSIFAKIFHDLSWSWSFISTLPSITHLSPPLPLPEEGRGENRHRFWQLVEGRGLKNFFLENG